MGVEAEGGASWSMSMGEDVSSAVAGVYDVSGGSEARKALD